MKVLSQAFHFFILVGVVVVTHRLHGQSTTAEVATFRTVMMAGDQAPGLPEGVTLSSRPRHVSVDNDGKVVFLAQLNGKGVRGLFQAKGQCPNENALYVESDDGLRPWIREGDAILPDQPELQVFNIQMQAGSDGGVVAVARLGNKPRISNPYCVVLSNRGGKPRTVLETGAVAADGNLTQFDDIQQNSSGHMTFRSRLQSADSPPAGIASEKPDANSTENIVKAAVSQMPTGIWSGVPGEMTPVAESGQPAPGKPDGVLFQKIGTFAQNENGNVAFEAAAAKARKTSAGISYSGFTRGVWFAEAKSKPRLVSSSIEGLPEGAQIHSFGQLAMNDADQIVVQVGFEIRTDTGKAQGSALVLIEGDHSKLCLVNRIGGRFRVLGAWPVRDIARFRRPQRS